MSKLNYLLAALLIPAAVACSPEIGDPYANGVDAGSDKADEGPSDPFEPPVCDESVGITFEQKETTPDIMLILDKSGSMGDPLQQGLSGSKWDIMRGAVAQVVGGKGDRVNFGLMMFPWTNDCNAGQVRVNPQLNNVASILTEMNSIGPSGRTPTHQSIANARAFFDGRPVNPDGRIVVLATDGLPVCSSISQSVTEIQRLQQRNIDTYVLGFGFGNVDISGLQQMAAAGGTGTVFTADSPQQLSFALDSILGEVTVPSCNFELTQTPANDADINVTVNGVDLPRDDPNGWSYDLGTNTITLNGAACETVQAGGADAIAVDLGCEGQTID